MGWKSGTKKTETTQTQKNEIDPAYLAKWNSAYDLAKSYTDTPYQAYSGDLVAGLTPGQTQAYGAAQTNALGAQGLDSYGLLGSLYGADAGTVGGTDLSQYMDPYTQQVIDKSLSIIDKQRMKALQGVGDNAQAAGAFGGDRQAILEAETNKQYGDLAGETASKLYSQAYTNAQNMAQQDVQNRLNQYQQKGVLAQLGIGAQNDAINQLFTLGTADQATQQAMLDSAYQQFVEQRDWNKNNASYLASILQGMPYNSTQTGTSTQSVKSTPSTLSSILGTIAVLKGMGSGGGGTADPSGAGEVNVMGSANAYSSGLSDRRTKQNISRIGTLDNGLPVYAFRYKHDPSSLLIGLMADEVKDKRPAAVTNIGGYDFVNYEMAVR